MIYADHAATTKTSPAARRAMLECMDEYWGNCSSLHTPGQRAADRLAQARETVARQLGCEGREVYFTSGGTEADAQALLTGALLGARKGRRRLIGTKIEHHAVLHGLRRLEREGFEVTLLDVGREGVVSPEAVADALGEDVALVSVMFANNEIGTIQPIEEIAALCRERGVLFHTDAVQAAGHLPIDVSAMGVDMLSLSGHKFGGPRGAGALICRRGLQPQNLMEGGAQERGRRPGTEDLPAIAGMAAALEEACAGMERERVYVTSLRDRLIQGLSAIPHSVLNGSRERRLAGNVNMCFEGIEGESLLLLLDQRGIAASSGSACTSGSLEPSHVLLALGLPHEVAHGSLRLTLGTENTVEDVDAIIRAVTETVAYLRDMSPVWEGLQRGDRPYVLQ